MCGTRTGKQGTSTATSNLFVFQNNMEVTTLCYFDIRTQLLLRQHEEVHDKAGRNCNQHKREYTDTRGKTLLSNGTGQIQLVKKLSHFVE
jgi:hypothetical protein